MKLKLAFLTLGILMATGTFAQSDRGGVGNGGYSVVCRDNRDAIVSAELLDIYEGRVQTKLKYGSFLNIEEVLSLVASRLEKFPEFSKDYLEELGKVKSIQSFIEKGNRLIQTNDAFPKIEKVGCNFEQLANYTPQDELLVSKEIYDSLDEFNKASLLVHEVFYAMLRKKGAKDSVDARKLTGEILSENFDSKSFQDRLGAIYKQKFRFTCGLKGSVNERIKNCSMENVTYALVSKVDDYYIMLDKRTGNLWTANAGNTLGPFGSMNQRTAKKTCENITDEYMKIDDVTWSLPTVSEIETGFELFLYKSRNSFWTSETSGKGDGMTAYWKYAQAFGNFSVKTTKVPSGSFQETICVGKIN